MEPTKGETYADPSGASLNRGRLIVENFKLSTRQVDVARAIRDAVEQFRPGLIEEWPGPPGMAGGLLAEFTLGQPILQPSRFVAASWDEILMSDIDVLFHSALLCHGTTAEVLACAQLLQPENWQAVWWANVFEKTYAELWDLRKTVTLETAPADEMATKDAELKKFYSDHGKRMNAIRIAKQAPNPIKEDVLDCLQRYGETYPTQQAFMDTMRSNHDKLSQRTIERWLQDLENTAFPTHWKKRSTK